MKKILFITTILFGILFMVTCCKEPNDIEYGKVKPLWSLKVSQYQIGGNGLGNLPLYNNIIITPITVAEIETIDDNRLCGVNIETRQIEWIFPPINNNGVIYDFSDKFYLNNYIYKNILVCSSATNTYCINLDDMSVIWEKDYGTVIIGGLDNKVCYGVVQDGVRHTWITNLDTNETTELPGIPNNSSYSVMKNWIMYFLIEKNDGNYVTEYSIENERITNEVKLPNEIVFHPYGVGLVSIQTGKMIFNYGRGNIICIDYPSGEVVWQYLNTYGNAMNGDVIIHNGILFLGSQTMYFGLDIETGKKLYQVENVNITWAISDGDYIYANRADVNELNIIDIKTGKILDKIICPEENGFKWFIKGTIHSDNFYVMGATTLYCYPTYPWN